MEQISKDIAKLEVELREYEDDFVCQSFISTYPDCIAEKASVAIFYMMQAEKDETKRAVEFLKSKSNKYEFMMENDRDVIMVYMK